MKDKKKRPKVKLSQTFHKVKKPKPEAAARGVL